MAGKREYFWFFSRDMPHATTQRCIESRTLPCVSLFGLYGGSANTRAGLAKDEGLGHGSAYSHLRRELC